MLCVMATGGCNTLPLWYEGAVSCGFYCMLSASTAFSPVAAAYRQTSSSTCVDDCIHVVVQIKKMVQAGVRLPTYVGTLQNR